MIFSLKGCDYIAQASGLGIEPLVTANALKGQDRNHRALSETDFNGCRLLSVDAASCRVRTLARIRRCGYLIFTEVGSNEAGCLVYGGDSLSRRGAERTSRHPLFYLDTPRRTT